VPHNLKPSVPANHSTACCGFAAHASLDVHQDANEEGLWSQVASFLAPPRPGGGYVHATPMRPAGPSATQHSFARESHSSAVYRQHREFEAEARSQGQKLPRHAHIKSKSTHVAAPASIDTKDFNLKRTLHSQQLQVAQDVREVDVQQNRVTSEGGMRSSEQEKGAGTRSTDDLAAMLAETDASDAHLDVASSEPTVRLLVVADMGQAEVDGSTSIQEVRAVLCARPGECTHTLCSMHSYLKHIKCVLKCCVGGVRCSFPTGRPVLEV
jgi:hypothetical protein